MVLEMNNKLIDILARDIMVTDVITASPKDRIGAVDLTMVRAAIGGVPVVDRNYKLLGIITQRDIMLSRFTAQISSSAVSDLMTHQPVTCNPDSKLEEILKKMLEHKIERLPVIDDNNKLIGLIVHTVILEKIYNSLKKSSTDSE
jgi:IMP dehydrogenase